MKKNKTSFKTKISKRMSNVLIMKKSFCLYFPIFLVFFSAITNTYSQIPEGGSDIIRDANIYYSKSGKGTLSSVNIDDQLFVKALRYATPADVVNPWDAQIIYQPVTGIQTNDVILVTFFARTISSAQETGEGLLNVVIENKTTYSKVIYQNVTIGSEWKQYYAPVKSNATLDVSNLNCAFFFGFISQTVEVGDIRYINYSTTKTIDELPETEITYIGREPDAAWRAEAQERISQIRKGNIQISVIDTLGNPVSNAEVTIAMTRHKFSFGSAIVASEYLSNTTYKAKIHEMFNEVVFENDLKWPSFISKTATQKNDLIKVLNDLDNLNIRMRGHNVLWPSWKFSPAFLANYKTQPDRLRLEIDKRIDDVCTFTRGRVVDWDVINEPFSEHEFMDILGREVMADWFKRVRNNDPYVKLYLNDYAILSSNGTNYPKQDSFIATSRFIDELGGGVQGIGLQGHFSSNLTPIPRLKTVLDKFSELDKEIKVTEFDIAITQQDVQADYTRDFMTMLFSHPSVTGILLWGFWESRHWEPNAAMYKEDWSIKPNGLAFRNLVLNQWWTKDTTQLTNALGNVNFNGFLGTYSYSVKHEDKENTGSFVLDIPESSGKLNEITISTEPQVPAEVKINIIGETVLCEGEETSLSIDVSPDFTIKWFNGDNELPETTNGITVDYPGIFHAEVSGKGIIVKSTPIEIVINTISEIAIDPSGPLTFCPGGSVTLTATTDIPFTYKWYKNGTFFSGSLPRINVLESGIYKVEVNSFGCKTFSPELGVTKLSADDPTCYTGISKTDKYISVSPNPFKNYFIIDVSGFNKYPVEINIFDLKGKVLYRSIIPKSGKIEIWPEVIDGYYTLKLQSTDEIRWTKLIRQ